MNLVKDQGRAGSATQAVSLWSSEREQKTFQSHNIPLSLKLQEDFIYRVTGIAYLNLIHNEFQNSLFTERCYKSCL